MQENPGIIAVGAGLAWLSEECRTGSLAGPWSLLARGKCRPGTLVGRSRAEELPAPDDGEIKREMPRVGQRNPTPGMFRAVAGILEQVQPLSKDLFPAGDDMRIPPVSSAYGQGRQCREQKSRRSMGPKSFPAWPVEGVTGILSTSMCNEGGISFRLPRQPLCRAVVQMRLHPVMTSIVESFIETVLRRRWLVLALAGAGHGGADCRRQFCWRDQRLPQPVRRRQSTACVVECSRGYLRHVQQGADCRRSEERLRIQPGNAGGY